MFGNRKMGRKNKKRRDEGEVKRPNEKKMFVEEEKIRKWKV